jgi:COMPASS component SWD2
VLHYHLSVVRSPSFVSHTLLLNDGLRHHTECVLFAGKGTPGQPRTHQNAVNYLSLYDNKILRKFRGHSDQIAKISLCPADDCFLTSSKDRTVR